MSELDIESLHADCCSDDPNRQRLALTALIERCDVASLDSVIPLFSSFDEGVRAEAARAVGFLGSSCASRVGPLLLPLLQDPSELVRDEAVFALSKVIYPPAIAMLKKRLENDPSWIVRAYARRTTRCTQMLTE